VLDREDAEQDDVDEQRLGQRRRQAGVDALGHDQVADEADGVEEGDEEDRIGDRTVSDSKPAHGTPPLK
jgi:hypothetical protein